MNKLLLIGLLFVSSTSISQLSSGLLAQYDFSGDALDASGNNYHGTVSGASLVNDRFGNPLSAYHFDGVDDNIYIPGFPTSYVNYSFCAWIKADVINQNDKGVVNQVGTHTGISENMTSFGIATITSQNRFLARHRADDGTYIGSTDNTDIDLNWHFVVATFDGDSLKYYKDGIQQNFTLINTSAPKIDTLLIGCGRTNLIPFGFYFSGVIDDIRVYNRELTNCEITTLYTGQACNLGIEELLQKDKELVKITDLMGREIEYQPNTPMIFIYSDGTTERVMKLED